MIDGVTTITLDMGWSIMALILLAVGLALACGYLVGRGCDCRSRNAEPQPRRERVLKNERSDEALGGEGEARRWADEIKTEGLVEKYAGMECGVLRCCERTKCFAICDGDCQSCDVPHEEG